MRWRSWNRYRYFQSRHLCFRIPTPARVLSLHRHRRPHRRRTPPPPLTRRTGVCCRLLAQRRRGSVISRRLLALPAAVLSAALTELELEGQLERRAGGLVVKIGGP